MRQTQDGSIKIRSSNTQRSGIHLYQSKKGSSLFYAWDPFNVQNLNVEAVLLNYS